MINYFILFTKTPTKNVPIQFYFYNSWRNLFPGILCPNPYNGYYGWNIFSPRIYDAHEVAKNRGLNAYHTGKIILEKVSDIQLPDKVTFYQEALSKQIQADELVEYTPLYARIEMDMLYLHQLF